MKRHELAKVLLDEIVRTRAQLARLQMVLARRTEEKISRVDQCEECETPLAGVPDSNNSVGSALRGD